jgi:hypothetical protein
MNTPIQRFYTKAKSKIGKDSDLPNFFVYHLTIEMNQTTASVSKVRECYEECDLRPPSWLASHFSKGLTSRPLRFIKKDGGYRLEDKLREQIAALFNDKDSAPPTNSDYRPAGIEYAGIAGGSKDCQAAIEMLIQYGTHIEQARILTFQNRHCILLTDEIGDLIAIKSGFASGYGGEGPRRFSHVLQLLDFHGANIEEYNVEEATIDRLDDSALTLADLKRFDQSQPVRPARWGEYL